MKWEYLATGMVVVLVLAGYVWSFTIWPLATILTFSGCITVGSLVIIISK